MKTKEKIQGFRHCRAFSCLLPALALLGCISCSLGGGINPFRDHIFTPVPGEPSCLDPVQATGFPAGTGTRQSPYLICSYEQFNLIRDDRGAHYAFGQDIDAAPSWSEHRSSSPCTPFNGRFVPSMSCDGFGGFPGNFNGGLDGRGYALRNLYSGRAPPSGASGVIFRGTVSSGAYIRNLGIIDPRVRFGTGGGILGSILKGSLENSYIVAQSRVAGFASSRGNGGFFFEVDEGSIRNSFTDFEIVLDRTFSGGLAEDIGGTSSTNGVVENCYTRGNITINSSGTDLGGIALTAGLVTISNVYSTVSIGRGAGVTTSSGGLFADVSASAIIAGTNYFVDSLGGANGITTGNCDAGATCVRGTTGTATSDADALAEIRALSVLPTDWSPDDWDLRGPTQVPALKYNGGPDVCGDLCGQIIPNQRD